MGRGALSLPVLLSLVVFGIGMIVLLIHLTGGTTTASLDGEAQAATRFADDFPGLPPRAIILTEDRHAAFLDLGDGKAGLVQAVGDRFLTRILDKHHVRAFTGADGSLSLILPDMTFRGGQWRFGSPNAAKSVADWLNIGNGS